MASVTRPWNLFSGIFGPGAPPARFVQTSNGPVPAVNPGPDLIAKPRYEDRLTAEKRFYENYVNIQDLPAIHIYWAHELVRPKLLALGLGGPMEMFKKYLEDQCARDKHRPCRFLSVGAGNCDIEIELAKYLCAQGHTHFVIECLDLNGAILERGRIAAIENEVEGKIDFVESDFNAWQPASEYDAVLANQVLHHVVNLEGLFTQIKRTLKPHGQFIIGDMIGRNGHQRWPEALDIVHEYWRQLPTAYRFNRLLNRHEELYVDWDCSQFGFEGIRAQDILPLLLEHFHFQVFFGFGNAIDPFVDHAFGHNFDGVAKWDRDFIHQIHLRDEQEMLAGRLTPTHMLAVVRNDRDKPTLCPERLTPEFCVRAVSKSAIS
jgi:SAM-dependent methyltransferase